ncbi:MAG: hypothetical protein FD129_2974 [bacterium]|nr:MAG: hypothetical protein FD129_2974 [bacterium]
MSGRLVVPLSEGAWPAGSHEIRWEGTGVAPGLYFISLEADGQRQTHKLIQQ